MAFVNVKLYTTVELPFALQSAAADDDVWWMCSSSSDDCIANLLLMCCLRFMNTFKSCVYFYSDYFGAGQSSSWQFLCLFCLL